MKHNKAANLSLIFLVVFMALSFAIGTKQYNNTREMIIANLNKALREAVKMHADSWLCRDTIQSYAKLQQQIGGGVTMHAYDKVFSEALPEDNYTSNAGIQISIIKTNVNGYADDAAYDADNGFIMSDTLMLMNSAKVSDAALSLRGYIYCPFVNVLKMTNMTVPAILFIIALCSGGFYFYFRSRRDINENRVRIVSANNNLITFGDLSLSTDDDCIYDSNNQRVNLTPMEYSLMEMFYRSSSHFLLKKDICNALWPGKDNADETLYTLVRRLKQTLSEHSNIKISVVRGRAYQLDTNDLD